MLEYQGVWESAKKLSLLDSDVIFNINLLRL